MLKELVAVFPVSGSKNRGGFRSEQVPPHRPTAAQGLGLLSAAPSLLLLLVVSCSKASAPAKPSPGCAQAPGVALQGGRQPWHHVGYKLGNAKCPYVDFFKVL